MHHDLENINTYMTHPIKFSSGNAWHDIVSFLKHHLVYADFGNKPAMCQNKFGNMDMEKSLSDKKST